METELEPFREHIIADDNEKTVYAYFGEDSKPTYTSRIYSKLEPKITIYPHTFDPIIQKSKPKKVKIIEFHGWDNVGELPKDFLGKDQVGFVSKRAKMLLSFLQRKFKKLERINISKDGRNRFSDKIININWDSLNKILVYLNREINLYDSRKTALIHEKLSEITTKIKPKKIKFTKGDLVKIFSIYDNIHDLSEDDIDIVISLLSAAPPAKISVTDNYIKTKDKINIAYLDDVHSEFASLLDSKNDNEKEWQKFFKEHGWILNNLFPYQVILHKDEAYVGGKTIENDEGRIVDFLVRTGFTDNYALIEIKTHKKKLFKDATYRNPDVFPLTDEFSGAINQCNDQKNTFMTSMGLSYSIHDPKIILIIGTISSLTKNQLNCFKLVRASQKHIEIVTFDELLQKIEGLKKVINLGSK